MRSDQIAHHTDGRAIHQHGGLTWANNHTHGVVLPYSRYSWHNDIYLFSIGLFSDQLQIVVCSIRKCFSYHKTVFGFHKQ